MPFLTLLVALPYSNYHFPAVFKFFVIFLVLMIVFAFLSSRPGNNVVYYPNRILKGLDPLEGGYKSRNPFSWIKEALTSSERDVIAMSGVDTAVYFVFLTTGLSPFFLI